MMLSFSSSVGAPRVSVNGRCRAARSSWANLCALPRAAKYAKSAESKSNWARSSTHLNGCGGGWRGGRRQKRGGALLPFVWWCGCGEGGKKKKFYLFFFFCFFPQIARRNNHSN